MIQQADPTSWEHFVDFLQWWTVERTALLVATISAAIALWGLYQNRRIARAAARPMMMVEYVRPTADNLHLKIKVTNKGKSAANNVRFTFEPDLPEPDLDKLRRDYGFEGRNTPLALTKALLANNTFETWPPGFESEYLFWIKPPQLDLLSNDLKSAEDIPARQKVIITFTDDLKKKYSESVVLDIKSVAGTTFTTAEKPQKS